MCSNDAYRPPEERNKCREAHCLTQAVCICRMLGLALLEMAGFILSRCAAERLVRTLPEALRHRRDQRIVLLVAYGCQRPVMAPRARQEEVCLHRQGL